MFCLKLYIGTCQIYCHFDNIENKQICCRNVLHNYMLIGSETITDEKTHFLIDNLKMINNVLIIMYYLWYNI